MALFRGALVCSAGLVLYIRKASCIRKARIERLARFGLVVSYFVLNLCESGEGFSAEKKIFVFFEGNGFAEIVTLHFRATEF